LLGWFSVCFYYLLDAHLSIIIASFIGGEIAFLLLSTNTHPFKVLIKVNTIFYYRSLIISKPEKKTPYTIPNTTENPILAKYNVTDVVISISIFLLLI